MLSTGVLFRTPFAEVAETIRWHLSPFRTERAHPQPVPVQLYTRPQDEGLDPPRYSLSMGTEMRFVAPTLHAVVRYAVWDLHAVVGRRTRDFLLVHAGAVVTGGSAVVLAGASEAGKSTLVAALLLAGCSYLSDEYGAIDPVTLRAYPYQKHLGLSEAAVGWLPELAGRLHDTNYGAQPSDRFLPAADIGAPVAGPAPVGAVVFLGPDREGPVRLTPVTRAATVEGLVRGCVNFSRFGERGAVVASRLARQAPGFRLDGGTPAARAEAIMQLAR